MRTPEEREYLKQFEKLDRAADKRANQPTLPDTNDGRLRDALPDSQKK